MGEESAAIREEIAQTRNSMEETVDAISYKTDVKSRLHDNVEERRTAMSDAIHNVKRTIAGTASDAEDALPDADELKSKGQQATRQAKQKARRGVSVAESNPLGLGLGAVAVGFLAGLLTPSTKVEDEQLGELADKMKHTIVDTGQEALERGREVAEDAAHAAVDAAKETLDEEGKEQAEQLASSAQSSAQSL